MVTWYDLVSRGYFPKEIPPVLSTVGLANALHSAPHALPPSFTTAGKWTRPGYHDLSRARGLKRRLGLPNPVAYYHLARAVEQHWTSLDTVWRKSRVSMTLPVADPQRAVKTAHELTDIPRFRVDTRQARGWLVKTDIAAFYASIYTHTLGWVLQGKALSKTAAGKTPGRPSVDLDKCLQACAHGQTKGIHIGPDASIMISETLLAYVDDRMQGLVTALRGYRFMDDYEFVFSTRAGAEDFLGKLEHELNELELELHQQKTTVIELPIAFERPWAAWVREFKLDKSVKQQARQLIEFFDRAFDFSRQFPDESIVSYALTKLRGVKVSPTNLPLLFNLVIHAASAEPGTLARTIAIVQKSIFGTSAFSSSVMEEALDNHIARFGQGGHGNELAWALWAAIAFQVRLSQDSEKLLVTSRDPIVMLMVLDAAKRGILSASAGGAWASYLTPDELRDSHWLVAYEAPAQGWLGSTGHIATDDAFSFLLQSNVHFYTGVNVSQPIKIGTQRSY